jgi:hypothetical protein
MAEEIYECTWPMLPIIDASKIPAPRGLARIALTSEGRDHQERDHADQDADQRESEQGIVALGPVVQQAAAP